MTITHKPWTANRVDLQSTGTRHSLYGLILWCKLLLIAALAASINLCFSQTPQTAVTVVSAADYRSYVAPQSQAALFGTNLADSAASGQLDPAGRLLTELAGTSVQICGEPAGLISVSAGQINIVVPSDLQPGTCPVLVTSNGRTSAGTADIRPVSPAFFTVDGSGSGRAAALNAVTFKPDPFSIITPENPSTDKGTRVALFGTGLRNVFAAGASSSNSVTGVYGMIVTASGKSWPVTIEYLGPASGAAGLDQVNIALPAAIDGSGVVSFTLTVGSLRSNSVTLNISNLSLPSIYGFTPNSGPPGSVISVFGVNLGTPEMIAAGRIAVSLTESNGTTVSLNPDYVDSSQLQFTVPSMPSDSSAFYYGPVTLCVRVDTAATCSSTFDLTPPVVTSTVPGQTFLAVTRATLQNGVLSLNQLGATQLSQALSASIDTIVAQYTDVVNSAASGNPRVITLQRQDGSQLSATADSAFINALDVLAASLQPVFAAPPSSSGTSTTGGTLQSSCLNSQEQALQGIRDAYRRARSASEAVIQTAVLAPVASALGRCVGATSDTCIANASTGVAAGELTANLLTGLLFYPLLAITSVDTQPVFLDSIQLLPSSVPSSAKPSPSGSSGSALLLPLGQQAGFNVQGRFVSIQPSQTAQQMVSKLASDALGNLQLPKPGDAAITKCDVCSKILETCPQCRAALEKLGNDLTNDIGALVVASVNRLLPLSPSTQAESLVPLTAGTFRIDPSATNEVTISAACSASTASASGIGSTGGAYEPFEFAVDPSTLLLSSEIAGTPGAGSVFSILNVAVGPAVPQLNILTDKATYSNREQAYVTASGFPRFAAVALSISGGALAEKIEVMAFSDASGTVGTFVPLSDAQQAGAYTLSAFVPNSSIRASAAVGIAPARLAVQVTPQGGHWRSSPQSVSVSAPGAQRIYYSVSQSTGTVPAIPPVPSATSNDGFITGPSGTLPLAGVDGQLTAYNYMFVAEDGSGLGSVTPAYVFAIDLRQPGNGPQITGIKTTPDLPLDGQAFNFVISGANFDPATAHVIFTGPGCPGGCTIANGSLSKSATQVAGSARLSGGYFNVTIQNGLSTSSSAFPLTVGFSTPTIAAIATSPNPPVKGQAFDFTISGASFDPSSAVVLFTGPGCPATAKCSIPNSSLLSKSSTQLSGTATLADGIFAVAIQNGSNGIPSTTVPLAVSGARISAITTSPNPAAGQAFSFTITGSSFDPNSVMVVFNGPGCTASAKCSIPNSALSSATSSQLSGTAILAGGSFTVTVQNGSGGTPSNTLSLTISGGASGTPQLGSIITVPNQPIKGQAFVFSISGTGFDPNSALVIFSGPGCTASTPCTIANNLLSSSKSATQLSGTMTLADGSFNVTVQNGSGGTPSNSLVLSVLASTGGTAPQVSGITTLPNTPTNGQSFTFAIKGTGFDPSSATVVFSGPGCTTATCTFTPPSLTSPTSTLLSGTATLAAGAFTVKVQNGPGGTASNAVALTVSSSSGTVTPQISGITTTPNPPVNGQAFAYVIAGTGFDPSNAIVIFSGPGCTVSSCSFPASSLTGKTATQLSGNATLAAGSFSVTVQNGAGGTLSSGVALTVSGSSGGTTPQLSGIATSPNPPISAQAFTFTITGTGFDLNNAIIVFNGPGCTASTCTVSGNSLTAKSSSSLSGSTTLGAGSFTVTVQNGSSGTPSSGTPLTVSAGSTGPIIPQLNGITTFPNPAVAGQAFSFTISGTGFDPNGATIFFNGPGCAPQLTTCNIPNNALSSASSTQLSGTAILAAGNFSVTVLNGPIGNFSNALSIVVSTSGGNGGPQLVGITTSPTQLASGQAFTFTISGSGIDPNTAVVSFSGPGCTPCSITNSALSSKTATSLSGATTLGAGSFVVAVQNGSTGATSNGLSVIVTSAGTTAPNASAVITAPNPPIGGQVFLFTITGTGFDPNSAIVVLNGPGCSPCSIANITLSSKSSTTLSGSATLAAGTFTVTVQNGSTGTPSTGLSLTVSSSTGVAPQITGLATTPNPPIGAQAFAFTISGSGFDPSTATVVFSGPGCTPCSIANTALSSKTATQLSGTTTLGAGNFTVTVQNGSSGAPSNGQVLAVSGSTGTGPQVSGITTSPNPPLSAQAFTFTINGTGFDPTTAVVSFTGPNCLPCSITNSALSTKTSTQLTGTATLVSGTFTITVQNGSGTSSNGVSLTVSGSTGTAPQISGINTSPNPPVNGQVFSFTISGTGFDASSALVNFTGTGCTPCSVANSALSTKSATQLAGSISLPTSGSYTVTVQNGSSGTPSNSQQLTVSGSSSGTGPHIDSISPSSPLHGQSGDFLLVGSGFDSNSASVTFSGPGCTPSVCTIPNNQLAVNSNGSAIGGNIRFPAAGTFSVTVQNGSGSASNSLSFQVR